MTKEKVFTEKKVREIQKSWADGILAIGRAFRNGGDYKALAREFLYKHYGYREGIVLFKPTMASVEPFRTTFEKALSYFVADNPACSEDHGFALNPWVEIKFENAGFIIKKKHAVAMGNYFFTDSDGKETKVEYTFEYFVNREGDIKIILHHSSLPCSQR